MGIRGAGTTSPTPSWSHHQLKSPPTRTGITFSAFLAEFLCVLGKKLSKTQDNLVPVLMVWSLSQPCDYLGDLQRVLSGS